MIYEKYKIISTEASDYFYSKEAEKNIVDSYAKRLKEIRKTFTKLDWEMLIADTKNARAKHEYTRMMKEKFPEEK